MNLLKEMIEIIEDYDKIPLFRVIHLNQCLTVSSPNELRDFASFDLYLLSKSILLLIWIEQLLADTLFVLSSFVAKVILCEYKSLSFSVDC